jgi:hypothetical protein
MAAASVIFQGADDIHSRARSAENAGPFTLYRADTHGTETTVVEKVSEDFAKAVMQHLEKKPHHQGYWYRIPEQSPA